MSNYDKEYYKLNKERKRKEWDLWARTLKGQFNVSKRKAKYSNQEWTLTFEEFSQLRTQQCYYCVGNLPETTRGLDRIDNSKGYTLDNVLPCCGHCNRLRNDLLTVKETLEMVKLLKLLRKRDDIWNG